MKILHLLIILLLGFLFRLYIWSFLPIRNIVVENPFFADLLNLQIIWPSWSMMIIGLINIYIIWVVGKKLLDDRKALVAALLYAISPWTVYLEVANSPSILWLLGLLIFWYGLIIIFKGEIKRGLVVAAIGLILLLYFSLLMWLVIPILILGLSCSKIFSGKQLRTLLVTTLIISLPILILMFKNFTGVKNLSQRDISIFADIGLMNTVNSFQGELKVSQFGKFGKIIENRYTYFSEHFIFNTLNQLTPLVYFTAQFKMFGFSFSPPILLGFIVPFILGLTFLGSIFRKYGFATLSLLALALPSILSKQSPDLGRLILVSPIIFFTISLGFTSQWLYFKNKYGPFLLILTLSLIIIQGVVVISDVPLREPARFYQIMGVK